MNEEKGVRKKASILKEIKANYFITLKRKKNEKERRTKDRKKEGVIKEIKTNYFRPIIKMPVGRMVSRST